MNQVATQTSSDSEILDPDRASLLTIASLDALMTMLKNPGLDPRCDDLGELAARHVRRVFELTHSAQSYDDDPHAPAIYH